MIEEMDEVDLDSIPEPTESAVLDNGIDDNKWSPTTKYIVAGLSLVGLVVFLVFARVLVAAMVIAALVASVLTPLADLFERFLRLNKRQAGAVAYITFWVLVFVAGLLVVPRALGAVQGISEETATLTNDIQQILSQNPTVFGITLPLSSWVNSISTDVPNFILPENILGIFSNVSENLIWITISVISIFYLLQERDRLREWAFSQAPAHRERDVRILYYEVRDVWHNYLRGQLVLSTLVGVITGIGVAAVGMRGAWAIGILAGVLDVIPNVGPSLAALVAIAVAYFTGSTVLSIPNLWFALAILGIFAVIQFAENIWWRPRILGGSLKIHPGIVFVGVMASIALAGVFMTLIIVPVMGTIGVLWRYGRARMLGLEPWPHVE